MTTLTPLRNALGHGHSHSKRRTFFLQQSTGPQRFHNGDGDSGGFTGRIQFLTCRIDCQTAFLHPLEFHQIIDVGFSRFHVVGWIDTKHQHVHHAALHSLQGNVGIMRTHADMADHTIFLQISGIFQHRAVKNRLKILFAVHIMDHAHIDVIRLQTLQ